MRIGGFQKFSLIDYPGKCAAVVFTQGCNFRCPYCHNPELVEPGLFGPTMDEGEILGFMKGRRGMLDGVVVTGGEPTFQPDLGDFLSKIKSLGFAVKLDTNGSRPDVLAELLKRALVDFIAMDIKAPLDDYDRLSGVSVNTGKIRESVSLIRRSRLPCLFRTTRPADLLSEDGLRRIRVFLGEDAAWTVQPCLPVVKRKVVKPA